MTISKKYLFLFGSSAFVLPLILALVPINELPIESLTLANDPLLEKPSFNWGALFSDSVSVKNENGKDTLLPNTYSLKEKLIGDHFDLVDKYSNQNFGFRPFYVRLRNQFDYTLFSKSHAQSVIIGKDGYLFEEQYIKSYLGLDFIGQDSINQRVTKLKYVQDELERQGKLVLVVIAPGKGYFYPEYIPDAYGKKVGKNNYEGHVQAFKRENINYIDFNDLFVKNKNKSKGVLYPKTGIHWSQYGMYNSLDSIISYIEHKNNIDLKDIEINRNVKPTSELKFKDNDIEQGLNLFTSLDHLDMTYPKFNYLPGEGKARPTLLTISDSFWWQIYDLGVGHEIFNEGKFWFYNQTVHPDTENSGTNVFSNQINLFEELQKRDIIILMATEANLYKFGFGFIEEAENTLKSGIENYKKRLDEIVLQIRTTPEWFDQVQKKAAEKGISLEEMLFLDAQYVYKMELQNK